MKKKSGLMLGKRAKNWAIIEGGGQGSTFCFLSLWVDSHPSYCSQNPTLFTIP